MALVVVLAGCYGSRAPDANDGLTRGQVTTEPAGQAAPEAAGRSGELRREAGGGGGAGGCAAIRTDASDPNAGLFDTAAFTGIGGAGAQLAGVCARCGWPSRGEACQALVYRVPIVIDPAYSPCWNTSLKFGMCLEQQSCICGGEIPRACKAIEAQLDTCLQKGVSPDPLDNFSGKPADWKHVRTNCGFGFYAPYGYRETPVQGTDSCVLQFAGEYCEYSADYGAFSGPVDTSGRGCIKRVAYVDDRAAEISTCPGEHPDGYTAGLHVPDVRAGAGIRLTIVASCRTTSGPSEAQALFRSIDFER